jgi:hypothetical protein
VVQSKWPNWLYVIEKSATKASLAAAGMVQRTIRCPKSAARYRIDSIKQFGTENG